MSLPDISPEEERLLVLIDSDIDEYTSSLATLSPEILQIFYLRLREHEEANGDPDGYLDTGIELLLMHAESVGATLRSKL